MDLHEIILRPTVCGGAKRKDQPMSATGFMGEFTKKQRALVAPFVALV